MKKTPAIFFALLFVCGSVFGDANAAKSLDVPYRSVGAAVDGQADDAVWKTLPAVTDFCHPWRSDEPQKTSLKLFYDDTHLYLLFEAQETTPVFNPNQKEEMDIAGEDRVEVYFIDRAPMENYYSIEMSPTGLSLDYQCAFHRQFDFGWTCPELKTAGEIRKDGYTVEAAYSLAELRKMGVLKQDKTIRAGFYRADFDPLPDGKIAEKWISWIHPAKPEEDFHVPETIGTLILE